MNERETPPQSNPEESRENPENPRMREMLEERKDDLIFDELKQYAEDPNNIKVISRREDKDCYVVLIVDGTTRTLDTDFGNLDPHDFTEIFVSENSFYRPLIYMSVEELTPHALYIQGLEIDPQLRGKGIPQFFYQRFEEIAREAGYKFFFGFQDNEKLVKVYLQMGRYFFEEIKPEFQKEFEKRVVSGVFTTIKFLDESDVDRYVEERYLHMSIEERMEYNKKMKTLL